MSEEKEITTRLRMGDPKAMQLMFERYYRPLCAYALRYFENIADAEDVVQDVFIAFWENKRNKPFEGSVKSYLAGAVGKLSLKRKYKAGNIWFEDVEFYAEHFENTDNLYEDEDLMKIVTRLNISVKKLPEKSRSVFELIVFEGKSYKEVGNILNVSVNTVKTHYIRAVHKLRKEIGHPILFFAISGLLKRHFYPSISIEV